MQELMLLRVNPRKWVLMQEFKSECGITVPLGFTSDGITVPDFLRWIVSPTGVGFNAAVVHDFLLKEGYGWEYANERFGAQLVEDEVSYLRRKIYMAGVTIWAKIRS